MKKLSNKEISQRLDKIRDDAKSRTLTNLEIDEGILLIEECLKRNLPKEAIKLKGIIGFVCVDD